MDFLPNILVVEDEPRALRNLKELLENHGYRVIHAKNEQEALKVLKEVNSIVDLIYLDVIFPQEEHGGIKFLRKLRELEGREAIKPRIPVIFLTVKSEHVVKKELARYNEAISYEGFIEKPLDKEKVKTLIELTDDLASQRSKNIFAAVAEEYKIKTDTAAAMYEEFLDKTKTEANPQELIRIESKLLVEDSLQYWGKIKKKLREAWEFIKPEHKFARIYLAILHGAVELERQGMPYYEKTNVINNALSIITSYVAGNASITKDTILSLENQLVLAGFKMLETNAELVDLNAYPGFIDEIDEDGIVKVILKIDDNELGTNFPIENVPLYLRHEGVGVIWIERIYSDTTKLGRFEPSGKLNTH